MDTTEITKVIEANAVVLGAGESEDRTAKLITRAAQMIGFGVGVAEIRDMLLTEGLTEESAFLTFQAARVFLRDA